jgi:hypothetical protein
VAEVVADGGEDGLVSIAAAALHPMLSELAGFMRLTFADSAAA